MKEAAIMSIALVDDASVLRTVLASYLASQGFSIFCEASNGAELLTTLQDATVYPDLCLLGTNMPVMDGCATARALKKHYPSIKIMAYSFFESQLYAEKMLECGADAQFSKEAPAEKLRDALINLFNTTL